MLTSASATSLSPQTIVIIAVVVVVVLGRQLFTRSVNPNTLWIVPLLYLIVGYTSLPGNFWSEGIIGPLVLVAGLVIGLGVGVVRGAIIHIHIDPDTHRLIVHGSVVSVLFYIAVLAARVLVRVFTAGAPAPILDAFTIGLLAFTVGMIAATRLCLYLKYLQQSRIAVR
jgi:hypothetical protein